MTVDQLIEKLAALPGDWEVIMEDKVGNYCEWEPVDSIEVGEWAQKDDSIFHTFKSRAEGFCDPNSVLLRFPQNLPKTIIPMLQRVFPTLVPSDSVEIEKIGKPIDISSMV